MDITIKPLPKQHLAYEAWNNDAVDDVVYGGYAGGGKTWWGCEALSIDALRWPGTKYFMGRKTLKDLMQSSFITLTQKVFVSLGLKRDYHWKFDGKYNVVSLRKDDRSMWSTIDLLDLAYNPSDPLYNDLGSREYTRGLIEEAAEVHFMAYDVLKSRVGRWKNREMNIKSKMGLTLNPSQDWPYRIFYDPWKKAGKPKYPYAPLISQRALLDGQEVTRTFVFIQAAHRDNEYTALEYAKNLATIIDPVIRARLAEGDWEYASAADTLFDAAAIADLFTNQVPASSDLYETIDVARFGGDYIVRKLWRGWDNFATFYKTKVALTDTADDVRTDMQQYGIARERVLFDEDGIGGGLGDMVPGIIGFHGGAAPFGVVGERPIRENYENLRSQCTYHAADKVRLRQARVSSIDVKMREMLAQDLQQFKRRDAAKDGKLKVMKKEDIKTNLGRSPDFGDAFIMRSYFDLRTREEALATPGTLTVHLPDYE